MAIKATVETSFGETRELYIRLNSSEVNNHGAECYALFRGFLSQQAFQDGKNYVWERGVVFQPDVSQPIWEQAYQVLKDEIGVPTEDC